MCCPGFSVERFLASPVRPPRAGPGTGIEGWGSREESPGEVWELTEPRGRPQRQVSGLRLGMAVAAMGYGKPLSSTWEETPMANTTHPPVGAPHLPGQGSGVTQVPTAGPGEPRAAASLSGNGRRQRLARGLAGAEEMCLERAEVPVRRENTGHGLKTHPSHNPFLLVDRTK